MIIRHKAQLWDDKSKWVKGYVIQATGLYTKIITLECIDNEVYDTLYRVDPTSVCMCTWFYCKDGKMIYENDIIYNKEQDMKLIVKYIPLSGKFILYQPIKTDNKTTYNKYSFGEFDSFEKFEVIGNVLDNEDEDFE